MLIADDHDQLRGLMVRVIDRASRFEVVADVGSAADAVERAAELQPDVVVLDHSLPDRTGTEVAPLITAAAPRAAIVMLSGAPPLGATPPGVLAWLTKGEPMSEILARLTAILDGRRGPS